TDIDDSGLHVTGGSLAVPSVPSYTDQSLSHFEASGVGSTLSLPGLTTLSNLNSLQISATSGGKVNLPNLTSYASYGTFNADGAGSVLDVSALTTVTQQNYWDIDATNGGEIKLTG